ncbi:hypothetical protein DIPPA_04652 [Diplonema papillatum]|nr:hypothetical protein DIPPA_04652 [Diplonema papillatum]
MTQAAWRAVSRPADGSGEDGSEQPWGDSAAWSPHWPADGDRQQQQLFGGGASDLAPPAGPPAAFFFKQPTTRGAPPARRDAGKAADPLKKVLMRPADRTPRALPSPSSDPLKGGGEDSRRPPDKPPGQRSAPPNGIWDDVALNAFSAAPQHLLEDHGRRVPRMPRDKRRQRITCGQGPVSTYISTALEVEEKLSELTDIVEDMCWSSEVTAVMAADRFSAAVGCPDTARQLLLTLADAMPENPKKIELLMWCLHGADDC